MANERARSAVTLAVGFGPALAWATWMTLRYAPVLGWGRSFALAAFTGMGVLGLSSLALAWTPWILDRAGLPRAGAWLRRYWDEDAR
jgi:hypothetical protein